jgi:hypothetical protein
MQSMPQIDSPTSQNPLPPTPPSQSTHSRTKRSAISELEQRKLRASRSSTSTPDRYQQNTLPIMPMAPTDPAQNAYGGQFYQWLPPTATTAGAAAMDTSGGRPNGLYGPSNFPVSPTRGPPGSPQSYSSMKTIQDESRRIEAARNATAAPPQTASKPFSGANVPSSGGSSPYMNLFRGGNNNGTIDNYTTLVKPELNQRSANQQFGSDIHSLDNRTNVQGLSIRKLDTQTQSLQGVNSSQYFMNSSPYFMNYGDYYRGSR